HPQLRPSILIVRAFGIEHRKRRRHTALGSLCGWDHAAIQASKMIKRMILRLAERAGYHIIKKADRERFDRQTAELAILKERFERFESQAMQLRRERELDKAWTQVWDLGQRAGEEGNKSDSPIDESGQETARSCSEPTNFAQQAGTNAR